jgi:polyhydroxyalkanoate synthase
VIGAVLRADRSFVTDLVRATAATVWHGADHPAATPIDATDDARFADRAWAGSRFYHLLQQAYLLSGRLTTELVDALPLARSDARILRFIAEQAFDAVAPTNVLLGNPAALREVKRTRGRSIARGVANAFGDITRRRGLPAMAGTSRFVVGSDLAVTPGRVVLRNPIMELIQYEASTPTVHAIPMLISPPWVNKFYLADLAPGYSLVQWLVDHGHTVFTVSYRNPDALLRGVGFDDYLRDGLLASLNAIGDITGATQVNLCGACMGGLLALMLAAWLPDDQVPAVASVSAASALVDFTDISEAAASGLAGRLLRGPGLGLLEAMLAWRGVTAGRDLEAFFRFLLPNELVWRYVSENWLMGREPCASGLLSWNADTMNVPHRAQSYLLRELCVNNAFAQGTAELAGRRTEPSRVTQDVFLVAAREDHIIPWQWSYRTAALLPGDVRFCLTPGGHIAGVVAPPHAGAHCWMGDHQFIRDPETWLNEATEHHDTWWNAWLRWLAPRSGPQRAAPPLGSTRYPPAEPAPGVYVHT